jgi:Bacterial Ig domain
MDSYRRVEMRVSRNWHVLRLLLAVAICFALTRAEAKAQTSYTYTVIADLFNCFNFGTPAINNKGEVAFGASCGAPLGSGSLIVLRGDGGTVTTIFDSTDTRVPLPDVISINDSGVVAFAVNGGCVSGGGTGIRTGDGGTTATVYDICTDGGFTTVIRPSISNTGAVAFMAASANSYDHVMRAKNGTLVTIAGPGTTPTSVGTLVGANEPSINNNDVVTFLGQGETAFGIFTGSGGAVTTISLDNPSSFNSIDDSGRVAFLAGSSLAVQTGDGGPVTTIATRTFEGGTYEGFPGSGASISAGGRVAFMGSLPFGVGVFTGPDPGADVVLKTGDVIQLKNGDVFSDPVTVTGVFIMREAINDSGQVAMMVGYTDSDDPNAPRKFAIIRADPPNNPPVASDDSFSVTAGGSVSDALSATDPDAEPITYSIVTNGAKGTAVLDNPSTGAFTYTANANASGDDTFTFKATDNRSLESNIATVTISIDPVSACAVDVTSSIAPVKGKGSKNNSTSQTLTLRNISSSAIAGPISIALDALTAGVTLLNAAGVTSCAAPAGSPYVNVDVGTDSVWSPEERVEVVLEFARESTGPGKKPAITYTQRVLAGAGGR